MFIGHQRKSQTVRHACRSHRLWLDRVDAEALQHGFANQHRDGLIGLPTQRASEIHQLLSPQEVHS